MIQVWNINYSLRNYRIQKQPFFKIGALKNLAILTEKHFCWRLFWSPEGLQLYLKETPTQVFSCKYCEIFNKAVLFIEHIRWLLLRITYLNSWSFLNILIWVLLQTKQREALTWCCKVELITTFDIL